MAASTASVSMSRAARSLSHLLTSPSKVAHSLDWKKASGSILSLRVNNDTIDLAVASHPSFDEPAQQLASIPLERSVEHNRKVVSRSVADALQQVVANYNVCGMVVSWPVQPEGWCGAPCGRVLNTLDQIRLTVDRPVCLYDANHTTLPEDEWGRAEIYSTTSNKEVHLASQEQYQDCTGKVAVQVWNDFMVEHWPELCQEDDTQGDDYGATHPQSSKKNLLYDSYWPAEDRAYQAAF